MPDAVRQAVDIIEREDGAIRIVEVSDRLGVSPRHLNRQFRTIVGVPPKHFARALQLNKAIGMILSGDEEQLTAMAHEAGFYDQSHFINTMRNFMSASPQKFLAGNTTVLAEFIGKSRQFG